MDGSAGQLEPGTAVGRYRVGEPLGGGRAGVVVAALDTEHNRHVALRVVDPRVAADPGFRRRFTGAMEALTELSSPHLVPVLEHGEDEGRLWVATEVVQDGDLDALVRDRGPAPLRTAADIVAQAADGLAAAHAAGLVHGRLSPSELLVRRVGQGLEVKVADVGLHSAIAGEGRDVSDDVHGLGRVLWTAATGRPYDLSVGQVPGDTPLAAAVERVIRQATATRAHGRYASAAEVRDDLRHVLAEHDDVDAVDRGRRRRAMLLVLVALVLLVAPVVGYALSRAV